MVDKVNSSNEFERHDDKGVDISPLLLSQMGSPNNTLDLLHYEHFTNPTTGRASESFTTTHNYAFRGAESSSEDMDYVGSVRS